jgi:nucleoside diphosphate kinase
MTMHGGTNRKRLFFMIKPDGIPREAKIRKMIEPLVAILASRLFDPVESDKIESLYHMHRDKQFYAYLLDYFRGKSVMTFLLGEREDVTYRHGLYADFLELVGDTDPAKAQPGTIRSMSSDSMEKSLSERRALRNLVHRSTTAGETVREASIFFWDYIYDHRKVVGEPGGLGRFFAQKGDGIFFEERLESGLQKCHFLASDEHFVHYQDLKGRKDGPVKRERALLETIKNGVSSVKKITLPSAVTTDE